MAEALNAQALPRDNGALPVPPSLDLCALNINDLALLADYFEAMASAALAMLNQPRFEGTRAADFADEFWGGYINRTWDAVVAEIEQRVPATLDEAGKRALAMIGLRASWDNLAEIAEIAASAACVAEKSE